LDVALERFYTGETQKHSALAHFGETPVTTNRPAWFNKYNARQTIEAGIKETKQVFYLNRLKVRSEPAIFLQEALTIFAANFIRWATVWIEQNAEQNEHTLPINQMGIKKQVQVAANTSAKVIQNSEGMLLRFSSASVFAGKQLFFRASGKPLRPNYFLSFFTILALIAQKLRSGAYNLGVEPPAANIALGPSKKMSLLTNWFPKVVEGLGNNSVLRRS